MATVTKTWSWTGGIDGWADRALSGNQTFAYDSANAIKVTSTKKNITNDTEDGWSSTGENWETWGVPAGATVIKVQVSAWKKKVVSCTNATFHQCKMRVLSGTTNVCASDLIDTGTGWSMSADSAFVAGTAGSTIDVTAGYRASNTSVRMAIEHIISVGGTATNLDVRWDDVSLTITYTVTTSIAGSGGTTAAGSGLVRRIRKIVASGGATGAGAAVQKRALKELACGGTTAGGAGTQKRVPVDLASSGTTLSGVAAQQRARAGVGVGGVSTAGGGAVSRSAVVTASGGTTTSGAALGTRVAHAIAEGGTDVGGAGVAGRIQACAAAGGTANAGSFSGFRARAVSGSAGTIGSGDGVGARGRSADAPVGTTIAGSAPSTRSRSGIGLGGATNGGAARIDLHREGSGATVAIVGAGGTLANGQALLRLVRHAASTSSGSLGVRSYPMRLARLPQPQAVAIAGDGGTAAGGQAVLLVERRQASSFASPIPAEVPLSNPTRAYRSQLRSVVGAGGTIARGVARPLRQYGLMGAPGSVCGGSATVTTRSAGPDDLDLDLLDALLVA